MKLFNHLPGIVCRPIIYKNHFILFPGQSLSNTACKLCKRLLFIQKRNNHTYEMRILYFGFVKRSGADRQDFWSFKQLGIRSEEHTSELQSRGHLVCRLLLETKKRQTNKE